MWIFQLDRAWFYSIFFHLAILLWLILGFDFSSPIPVFEQSPQKDVINAIILGDTPQTKIITQTRRSQPTVTSKETPPLLAKKDQPTENKTDVIALKLKQKKLTEENQHDLLAKNLLADLKKIQAKKAKQAQALFADTLRKQAEASLREQLLQEKIRLKAKESKRAQGEINRYKALIVQAISENWLVPMQADKKRHCELLIRLAPSGLVLHVQITKTSGDSALDSSARAAVLKASPLPVPQDGESFKPFREFVLKVKPENKLNRDR